MGGLDYLVLNHILVHNLGGWEGSPENLTKLNTIMDVNFKAYVHLATHAMPHLDKTDGHVIVVSSVAGMCNECVYMDSFWKPMSIYNSAYRVCKSGRKTTRFLDFEVPKFENDTETERFSDIHARYAARVPGNGENSAEAYLSYCLQD